MIFWGGFTVETFDFIEVFGVSLMFGFGFASIVDAVGMGVHVLFRILRQAGEVDSIGD